MTNKEMFLRKNVGFHLDDLSLVRQAELEAIRNTLGLSNEWTLLALSKDTLEGWEKWGFNIFKKADFHQEVDLLLAVFDKMDESRFKKENNRLAANDRSKKMRVSDETFMKVYNGLKQQGGVSLGNSAYWELNRAAIKNDKYFDATEFINYIINKPIEEITDDEKTQLCSAVIHTTTMNHFKGA